MSRRSRTPILSAIALLAVGSRVGAQPTALSNGAMVSTAIAPAFLTLREAFREADASAFANRVAIAANHGATARARIPLKGLLPSARIESGIVQTTDPIGVFGMTLRQRAVTAAAFAPDGLNYPSAKTNVQGAAVLEIPLFNADALLGLHAARASADATRAEGDWTVVSTHLLVIRAYFGAILAREKISVLTDAMLAATASTHQVDAMVQQGLVTKADALQARVRADDIASELLGARNDAESAQQQLGLLLGRTGGALPALPMQLPQERLIQQLAEADTTTVADDTANSLNAGDDTERGGGNRADIRAARAAALAATANRSRARATLLPRVNGIARYDWNAPHGAFAGRPNWTVAVMASWSVFGGGGELADVAAATADAIGAQVGEQATRAQQSVEVSMARRSLQLALARLDLANHANAESHEAYRLIEKRYVGGLTTVAELLSAESASTMASLTISAARFALIDAVATYRRANGGDPASLASLEPEQ
jgi:outer membrane protein